MKQITNVEVTLINLDANDILCTSLTVASSTISNPNSVQAPAREGVFSAPVEQQSAGNGIW